MTARHPELFEGLQFGHPLTAALFDRTVEQREAHGTLTAAMHEAGLAGGDATIISDLADFTMYYTFLEDLHALVDGGQTLEQVRQDIAALHEALPLPMIERMQHVQA